MLTAKLEIGGPMASLYLLGNPNHYTNQKFVVFYWKSYVAKILYSWKQDSDVQSDKVMLLKHVNVEFIGLSIVDDNKYRLYLDAIETCLIILFYSFNSKKLRVGDWCPARLPFDSELQEFPVSDTSLFAYVHYKKTVSQ